MFRRLAQTYLAAGSTVQRWVDDFVVPTGIRVSVERAKFAAELVVSALAPSNLIFTDPAGLKRAFDTVGASGGRGAANLVHDVRHNRAALAVDREPFQVGRHLARSAGEVVHRDDMAEVIQYAPTTARVRARPLLLVPPLIGKFSFLDLRPGRSFIEVCGEPGHSGSSSCHGAIPAPRSATGG